MSGENGKATVLDFDDLCDANDPWPHLLRLKERVPDLKVTLFAIPARCGQELLKRYDAIRDWCRLGVHGWRHARHECLAWTSEETQQHLDDALALYQGFDRVFKAPNWSVCDELYAGLKAREFIIADHYSNIALLPQDQRHYIYNIRLRNDAYRREHGHIQGWQGTGLVEAFDRWAALKPPFLFVSDAAEDRKAVDL